MSDETLIYETDESTDTTYVVTGIGEDETRYYQLVVEDYWGLQSESNVEIGELHNWFVKTFNVQGDGVGFSVQQTTDGGYIIGGLSSYWDPYMLLIKTDSQGNEEWTRTLDYEILGVVLSVQQTSDGGYIMTGALVDDTVEEELWLIKTDSEGVLEWDWTFSGQSIGYSVKVTNDGGYIITGWGNMNGVLLIKRDSNGYEWHRNFTGGFGYSVEQTTDGGYIISGSSYEDFNHDMLLIKTDSQGNEEWTRTFGESYDDRGYSVQQTTDGGYIVTGIKDDDCIEGIVGDVLLIKTDSYGNEEWNQTFSGQGRSIQQTNDGGYAITGYTGGCEGDYGENMLLIKTDMQGNEEWSRMFYGGSGYSLQQTTDGGYIITGQYGSYVWLIKTDSEGNTAPYGD
jgi:hypothetical protein